MMDWDDLRLFLGVARDGSLIAAGRRLDVDHTTVSRRLSTLEKAVGTRLFGARYDVTPDVMAYAPTPSRAARHPGHERP